MTARRDGHAAYDVVIAGYGGAGAAAAIAAHDAGARVLLLEKSPAGGGSTAESGGSFAAVLDRDGAIGERYRVREDGVSHGGTSLWNLLRENVECRGIEVRLEVPVTRLLTDRGRVSGVVAHGADGPVEVAARNGVVLTTGGFGYSADLLREWVGAEIPAFGPPGRNDGSGLRMALEAGAALWHMNAVACGFGYRVPGLDAAWMCIMRSFGFLMVDATGSRFLDEPAVEHHAAGHALIVRDFATGEFGRLPSYLIFDEATRRAGRRRRLSQAAGLDQRAGLVATVQPCPFGTTSTSSARPVRGSR